MSIEIIKDFGDLIAVYKPAGWLTIPGRGNKESIPVLSNLLGKQLRGETTKSKNDLFIIHRLDEGTSGIVLFARTSSTHKEFSQKFENGEIKKTYITLIEGALENQIIDAPIFKIPSKKIKSVVDPKGKPSRTVIKTLKESSELSLLEVTPLTGRSHQIRVHLAYINHPILGDKLYGGKTVWEKQTLSYPLLHASKLEFVGKNGEIISIDAAPTGIFQDILKTGLKF